jgi:hypothetical protein
MMSKTEQRFEAAKAAMQGLLCNPMFDRMPFDDLHPIAVMHADALLAELARTEPKCPKCEDGGTGPLCGAHFQYAVMARTEPTVKESLTVPDADGWVVRIPTDPIPERHNGVRFGDGVERLTQDRKWPNDSWNHTDENWPSDFITHYRPA